MARIRQVRIWSDRETICQLHCPQDQTTPPGGLGIDPRLGAAILRAPAASREDSRPQAILKFHRPSSLDYRARHGPPVNIARYSSDHWIQYVPDENQQTLNFVTFQVISKMSLFISIFMIQLVYIDLDKKNNLDVTNWFLKTILFDANCFKSDKSIQKILGN